ncbi:TnsD family Tn7-like transposition protein [Pseudomonas sp. OV226]|uniref:TnsD family Tn7-like transposition protein n=1 Tax=Pseudomonas sp. OV226 TaxID=2135588 RepID=UPI0013049678|nr:TnsD family Tn7-like transposition protein [Pseudomonas sp. OV226]
MNSSAAQSQDIFLRWFEDETFYSLCCRQHHFLAHLKTSETLAWLFGSDHCAITHDFPCNLDALNSQAQAAWGDPISIIREHTILPLFFPFQSEQQIAAVVRTMKNVQIGSIKYRLGLLTGRFGAEHPLKACTACMATDRARHGTAYWHLTHQYPGVVLCPVHGLMLTESTINRQWSGSFQWTLPSEGFLAAATAPMPSATANNALQQLGSGVQDLATCGISRCFNPTIVRSVYKEALMQLGKSKLERVRVAVSFAQYASQLQPYPPLTSLPITAQRAEAFIDQLTRNPRGHCHPLKHLTLITWLFGRLGPFIESYDRLSRLPHEISKIKRESSAKAVKVDEPMEGEMAKILVLRKPKKLKPQVRIEILECLQNGDSKDLICSQFGLSICTVNRLLRSEPAVLKSRSEKQQETVLLEHRTEWIAVITSQPGASTKSIRSVIPNIYAWLYRNDREWLLAQTHNLPSGRCGNYSNVDWHGRDCELAHLVNETLNRNYGTERKTKVPKVAVFTLIPSLSRSLEKSGYYLKTRKLLSEII